MCRDDLQLLNSIRCALQELQQKKLITTLFLPKKRIELGSLLYLYTLNLYQFHSRTIVLHISKKKKQLCCTIHANCYISKLLMCHFSIKKFDEMIDDITIIQHNIL